MKHVCASIISHLDMFILLLKLIEQSKPCVCSRWQSEKHLGAGATVITGKKVCVCVCAVCFACCVLSSESCSRAVVTEHPNQGRASVGCLCACVISLRAE